MYNSTLEHDVIYEISSSCVIDSMLYRKTRSKTRSFHYSDLSIDLRNDLLDDDLLPVYQVQWPLYELRFSDM